MRGRGPDPDWHKNRLLRTVAKRGKRATLRIEPDHGGLVDILGSTQPLARFVYRDESFAVIDVPPGVIQVYRIDKVMGVNHLIVEFMLEYLKEESDAAHADGD